MEKYIVKCATGHCYSDKGRISTQQCENMREYGATLERAAAPDDLGELASGHRVLIADRRGDVECLISECDSTLYLYGTRGGANEAVTVLRQPLLQLDSAVKRCAATGKFLVVYTSGARRVLEYVNGGYTELCVEDAVAQLAFRTVEVRSRSTVLPVLKFSESESDWTGALSEKNKATATSRMVKAYDTLADEAEKRGEWLQPRLLRYVVRLWDDTVLYASAPVLVGVGLQGGGSVTTSAVSAGSSGFLGAESGSYSVKVWGVEVACLTAVATEWLPLVKSIDVVESEIPTVVTGLCTHTKNTQGVNDYSLTSALHTVSVETVITYMATSERWRTVATLYPGELKIGGTTTIYRNSNSRGGEYASSTLDSANSVALCTYVPRAVATSAGRVHEGGGVVLNRLPWNPMQFFAGEISDVSADICVTIVRNTGLDIESSSVAFHCDKMSTHLSPFIAVPMYDALSMRLQISSQGKYYSYEYSLYQSDNGGFSYWATSLMEPVELVEASGAYVEPRSGDLSEYVPERMLTTYQGNPFVYQHEVEIDRGEILEIVPAVAPMSAGVFYRLPLYLFTDCGIYSSSYEPYRVSAVAPRLLVNITLDAWVGKLRQGMPCVAVGTDVYFSAMDMMCKLSGITCNVFDGESGARLMYRRDDTDEIYALSTDGELRVYNLSGRYYTYSAGTIRYIMPGAFNDLIAVSDDGRLLSFSSENKLSPGLIKVHTHPVEMDRRLKSVRWRIYGNDIDLKLSVYGLAETDTEGSPVCISTHVMRGNFHAPIEIPIVAPFFNDISFEITGSVTDKVTIHPICITQ